MRRILLESESFATLLSTLPFAIAFVASVCYAKLGFPHWLPWLLWLSYGAGAYGILRSCWVPYLFVNNPVRAHRYQVRFARTDAFLPERNGIRPDTLHVVFHAVFVVALILLGLLSFSNRAFAL